MVESNTSTHPLDLTSQQFRVSLISHLQPCTITDHFQCEIPILLVRERGEERALERVRHDVLGREGVDGVVVGGVDGQEGGEVQPGAERKMYSTRRSVARSV